MGDVAVEKRGGGDSLMMGWVRRDKMFALLCCVRRADEPSDIKKW